MAKHKGSTQDTSSAHPPGWPGIPGRSEDHERSPGEEGTREAHPSGVTEAQRGLEREQHQVERK